MLTKIEFIPQIILFFKSLTLIYNFELRPNVLKNIKDVMSFLSTDKSSSLIQEEDANDIKIIVSFINNKMDNKLGGYTHSDSIQNFENDTSLNSNYVYVKSNRITKK